MKTLGLLATVILLTAAAGGSVVLAQGPRNIRETLTGYQEVPAVSTTASGEFRARISPDETSIAYELSYRDLRGSVQQAHIHLGQHSVNGGISVFLCSNLGNGPAGTQACPAAPATISGTIRAVDVIGPTAQGLDPGQLADLVRAIRAGVTYANVHSTKFPGGEIRAQLVHDERGGRAGGGDD